MEIDLRDTMDRKHGGKFIVKSVAAGEACITVSLRPAVEERGSSEQYYKRNWTDACIHIPIGILPQLVAAAIDDWRRLYRRVNFPE
jgi:hypothetical protein